MKPFAIAAALALALPAAAHDYVLGEIAVGHPFAYATPPGAPVGGGYMVIANEGEADDVLLSVEVQAAVAGTVQLHEMTMRDGVMRMDEVRGGIPLPAGATVALEPGGLHVMFMGLAAPFEAGAAIPATLTFREAGPLEVEFQVVARGEGEQADGGHGADGHGPEGHGGH
ncbi:MAG: copper chaperone PCu(A)C [Hasllibacter sp.]